MLYCAIVSKQPKATKIRGNMNFNASNKVPPTLHMNNMYKSAIKMVRPKNAYVIN